MLTAQKRRTVINSAAVCLLLLIAAPFAFYALERGLALGSFHEQNPSRLFSMRAPFSNIAIYTHMVAGGLITLCAPLQLLVIVRQRWPFLHRALGYLTVTAALVTGVGGLFYILARGTIGGVIMDLGFGVYGLLMICAALRSVQLARRRDPMHRVWAERLVILALASWLYRVHYGIWEIATEGLGSNADFSGPFDIAQVFAFYLPYLLFHAWYRRGAGQRPLA